MERGVYEIVDMESLAPKDHREIAEAGHLAPSAVFVDGAHIKANANIKKAEVTPGNVHECT